MTFLDMKTIVFSHVVTDLVCAVAVVFLWYRNRKRFAGLAYWVADYVMQVAAVLLVLMRGNIPDVMSMVLSNTLVVAGTLAMYMGLLRFVGKTGSQVYNYSLIVVFALVHSYFSLIQPNLSARTLNLSIGILIFTFQCAWLLLWKVGADMRTFTRGAGTVFGVYSLVSVIRVIIILSGPLIDSDLFNSGTQDTVLLLAYQMLFIIQTYSLVLMVNRRLLTEVLVQEERFSKAFHSSPYAITLTRLSDGRIFEVNDGFLNMTGFKSSEVIGKTTLELGLWAREEDRMVAVNELSKNAKIHGAEFQFRKKSGELMTGLLSADMIVVNNQRCILSSIGDIKERRLTEDLIRIRLNLFEFAGSNSLEELLQKTLDEVDALTNSPIGFYHFVEEDQETLSLQAWSTRTVREFCTAEGKGMHYRIDQAGVWTDCVRQRRPVIHNDYASLPHRKGMPSGHAPVVRELVVPIMRAGRIVAILGIGNKPSDYTERDIEVVSFLADVVWQVAERKMAEEERARLIHELKETLGKVKTLSGLLPICANCKKVRDDKGYWTQIEAFVRDHSEAEFSHGICPDCMKRLYPEYSEDAG